MFNEKDQDRNDSLGQRLQRIGGQMNPSPALKKAAKTGVPLRPMAKSYTAGTHIRKFAKAVLLYAACIALFLGAILLIPKWWGGNEPTPGGSVDPIITSKPIETTAPPVTEECKHLWVTSDNTPSCTEGCYKYAGCDLCGLSSTAWLDALGHDYVDGICTRCGEAEVVAPETEVCEHDQSPATCPYCACDEHVWITSENTATCTEGCRVVNTCIKCGYSHEEWQDPIPHDYASGKCIVCGKAEAVVTAGSVSLLLNEKAYQITTSMKTNYYSLSNSDAPYYFRSNHFTDPNALLEGSTVTDIRVAVLSANKGDTLTVSVVRMNGNVPGEALNTYVLTAPEKIERNCLLFGGLSIRVPVGYMLAFGAPGDTVELVYTDNTSLTYTFASTVRGEFENKYALMIDVYGVRDLDGTLNWMKKLGCPDSLLPSAVRPLNATEIDAARTFMNSDARWIITEETFFKPEDIRPYMLFYMGNGTDQLSDGEFEALKAIRGDVDVWGDCSKMTDAELDAYLMQYIGIEMKPSMIGRRLYYLEEYDTYYFFATDANFFSVSNLIGWLTEDGNYLVRSSGYMDDYTVLLKPTENGFLIQQVVWNRSSIHWD